jgi:hypothetical protein
MSYDPLIRGKGRTGHDGRFFDPGEPALPVMPGNYRQKGRMRRATVCVVSWRARLQGC